MSTPARHSQRCRECKLRVRQLLEAIYGRCEPNHRFSWSTRLSSYAGTSIHVQLNAVVAAIEDHRGYRIGRFVRASRLAPCDFWVPIPGFVVEFDESQHFTAPRRSALSVYTDDLALGFSPTRWIKLCERHNASDTDPPYRDEQRAWYDTLRGLVPIIHGYSPTVRLYASDLAWCSLDPTQSTDRQRFVEVAFQNAVQLRADADGHPTRPHAKCLVCPWCEEAATPRQD